MNGRSDQWTCLCTCLGFRHAICHLYTLFGTLFFYVGGILRGGAVCRTGSKAVVNITNGII